MVVLMVLLTIAAFLLLDWYLVRWRNRVHAVSPDSRTAYADAGVPVPSVADLFFHPGHTWVRVAPDGLLSIGVSDFAAHFAGKLADVELPREGTSLGQGEPAWTLVSKGRRRLPQVMPVEGKVLEVNRELLRDPQMLQRSPYVNGWVLKARARRLGESLRNLLHGRAAETWLDSSKSGITSRLSPALGALAQDGGQWVATFGDLLPDEEWEMLRKEHFPTDTAEKE
jgi:glycine cleavage system H lipoate-binding protein